MVEAFGLSHQGLVRANNEDQFAVSTDRGICVLADGMGGAMAGERASALAVQTVMDAVTAASEASSELLRESFLEADRRVMELAATDHRLKGMGTTLVAALETEAGLVVCNIGDSRCYLYDGALRQLTSDQTWVNEIGRALGLDAEALRPHPMRHALTAAIGAGVAERVQSRVVATRAGDVVLLSSDGLHGVVDDAAIAEVLGCDDTLRAKCERLVDMTLERGAPDNITVVLARL